MRIKEKRKELDPQIIQIVQVSAGIVKIYNYFEPCVFELHESTDMWIFLIANTNTTWSVAGWTCRCGGTRYRGPHISSTQINPCIVQGSTVIFLRMQKNLPANWNTDEDVSGNPEIEKFIAEIRNFIGGF